MAANKTRATKDCPDCGGTGTAGAMHMDPGYPCPCLRAAPAADLVRAELDSGDRYRYTRQHDAICGCCACATNRGER